MTRILVTAIALASLLWPAAATAAASCKAPRMLVVLDKSSSMADNKVGDKTRWAVAKEALSTVVKAYQGVIDFGLMIFPDPANVSKCVAGVVKVPIASGNAQAIIDQLAKPPVVGSWTPIAQTLYAAGELPELNNDETTNNILLITDGEQWCSPKTAAIRFLPVDTTTALAAKKIKTYVVGFSQAADTLALNKMAAAADTKISPDCDPTSEDGSSAKNCYYQANSPNELLDALQKIAKQVGTEVCDGIDNDCDGQIDEELTQECTGSCGAGTQTCTAGVWSSCTSAEPTPEECDNKDNDCDGVVDEDLTRSCTLPQGGEGTQTCEAGTWSDCVGSGTGAIELCDGIDNDGDEVIDGPNAICEGGGTCVNGSCVAATSEASIPDGGTAGCDCRTAPSSASSPLWLLVPLLAVVVRCWRRLRRPGQPSR